MISAEYVEKLACPYCKAPVRKLGRWTVEDGEFFFETKPIICGERHVLPHHNPRKWTQVTIQRPKLNREGIHVGIEPIERYHYLATHECVGDVFLGTGCTAGELLQHEGCVPYRGDVYDWMNAPQGFVPMPKV